VRLRLAVRETPDIAADLFGLEKRQVGEEHLLVAGGGAGHPLRADHGAPVFSKTGNRVRHGIPVAIGMESDDVGQFQIDRVAGIGLVGPPGARGQGLDRVLGPRPGERRPQEGNALFVSVGTSRLVVDVPGQDSFVAPVSSDDVGHILLQFVPALGGIGKSNARTGRPAAVVYSRNRRVLGAEVRLLSGKATVVKEHRHHRHAAPGRQGQEAAEVAGERRALAPPDKVLEKNAAGPKPHGFRPPQFFIHELGVKGGILPLFG